MTSIKTVAIAGGSGSMGKEAVEKLLEAGFIVTALTRAESKAVFPPGVIVARVDYQDPGSLKVALSGQDALVSTVGYAGMAQQPALFDAAIAVGVKRIIPSEYGADPEHARARNLPVFAHKVQTETQLRAALAAANSVTTSYTLICNNEFFDWDLDNSFGVDLAGRKVDIFDGGEHVYSAAPMSFVARAIVAVLQRPDETRNRVVRLHGMSMTQNKLLGLLQRFMGTQGWTVRRVSIADREDSAYAMLRTRPQDMFAWAVAFLHCAVYGAEFGNDFSANNDNELLGLRELSEVEVEDIVRQRV